MGPLPENMARPASVGGRLRSLDAYRGIAMFLLLAESAGLYVALENVLPADSFPGNMAPQGYHHEWHGLTLADIVQPAFLFIVGVAMAFSILKRRARGDSWGGMSRHLLVRCFVLFWLGVLVQCAYAGRPVWELWNVLTQLSIAIPIAFLLFRWRLPAQIAFSLGLLVLVDLAFRFFPVDGFGAPFVRGANLGSWFDLLVMGKTNEEGWVATAAVPSAVFTIWGVAAGKVLAGQWGKSRKVIVIGLAGAAAVLIGYGLDAAGIVPMIRKTCTGSLVLVAGGWSLVALAVLYGLIDVAKIGGWAFPFVVLGMNPLLIYLVSESLVRRWILQTEPAVAVSLLVLLIEWGLCYLLYRKGRFIRV